MDVKPFSVILFCHAALPLYGGERVSEPHHTFSVILAPFVILPSPSEGFRTLLHAFKKHLQRRRKRAFKALFPNRMRLFALSMLYLRNYFLGLNLYTFSPPTFKSFQRDIPLVFPSQLIYRNIPQEQKNQALRLFSGYKGVFNHFAP